MTTSTEPIYCTCRRCGWFGPHDLQETADGKALLCRRCHIAWDVTSYQERYNPWFMTEEEARAAHATLQVALYGPDAPAKSFPGDRHDKR